MNSSRSRLLNLLKANEPGDLTPPTSPLHFGHWGLQRSHVSRYQLGGGIGDSKSSASAAIRTRGGISCEHFASLHVDLEENFEHLDQW